MPKIAETNRIYRPATSHENEIRDCPPEQFAISEIRWSREPAISHASNDGVDLSSDRHRELIEFVSDHTKARHYHVSLIAPNPDRSTEGVLKGSGTLVRVDDHVGILSARHVFAECGVEGDRFPDGGMAVLGNFDGVGAPEGFVQSEPYPLVGGIAHLPHRDPPVSGVPDISFFLLNDPDVVERLRERAFPFDVENCSVSGDALLNGSWFVCGARAERSTGGRIQIDLDRAGFVDRVYERSGMRFLSTFVDPADAPRSYRRDWHGTSGGGLWQQQLTQVGLDKVRHGRLPDRDDFSRLRLVGVPFYHSAVQPVGKHGERYGGEVIAHQLTPDLVNGIRTGVLDQAADAYRRFRASTRNRAPSGSIPS